MNSSYPVISFTASGRNQSRYEILQILFRIRVKIGVVQEERLEGHEDQVVSILPVEEPVVNVPLHFTAQPIPDGCDLQLLVFQLRSDLVNRFRIADHVPGDVDVTGTNDDDCRQPGTRIESDGIERLPDRVPFDPVAGEEESLPVSGVLGKAQIGYKQSGIEFESVVGHQDVAGQRFQFQSVRIVDYEAALPVVAEQIVLDQGRDGNSWRNDESQSMIVMELIVADVDLPERDGRFPAR